MFILLNIGRVFKYISLLDGIYHDSFPVRAFHNIWMAVESCSGTRSTEATTPPKN